MLLLECLKFKIPKLPKINDEDLFYDSMNASHFSSF